MSPGGEAEFVKYDLIKALEKCLGLWVTDEGTMRNVTMILRHLTLFESYCKAVILNDLTDIFTQIHKRSASVLVAENIAAVFLNYVHHGNITYS